CRNRPLCHESRPMIPLFILQLPQRFLPFSLQPRPRDSCPPSAVACTQAKTASRSAANPGSNILDSAAPPPLVCMEPRPGYRQTRKRCRSFAPSDPELHLLLSRRPNPRFSRERHTGDATCFFQAGPICTFVFTQ